MSNEDFNKLTGPEAFAETTADIKGMIPSMNSTMANFHTLQTDIIKQMIEYIAQLPAEVGPELINQLLTPISNPNALFKWTDVYDFFKNIFGSDAETLRFLEKHGFASRAEKPQFTGVEFDRLKQFLSQQQNVPSPEFIGPPPSPPESLTQRQILDRANTYLEYRQLGGLLTKQKWNEAKFGIFPTDNSEITRQINLTIKNITGKFISGATAPRRATQSTNITLKKLENAISLAILNLNRTFKISPQGKSGTHVAAFIAFRTIIQRFKDWKFTYR